MSRGILFSFVGIILFSTFVNAQWVSLDPLAVQGSAPKVELISSTSQGAVIKVNLSGFWIKEFESSGRIYQSINLGDEDGVTTEVGLPEISHISRVLAIPDQGIVNVEVIEKSNPQFFDRITIPPARQSWEEGQPESPYVENADFYRTGDIYPSTLAKTDDPAVFRDFRIARVSIFPVRYSPQRQGIEAYASITVKVTYGAGLGINPKSTPLRPITPSFAKIYRSFIFNYPEVLQQRYDNLEDGYDIMLCVVPDAMWGSFQPYAEWKTKSGTFIIEKKFSEIGVTSNNPTALKDCILNYYNGADSVPSHVLIVGDYGVAPIKRISYDYTFAYDDYFVELEGNDYFPEMMIGRFTNATDYKLQVLVSKSMGYERDPYVEGGDYFVRGIVCSNDNYQSQIDTKRFTDTMMMEYGHFLSVDTMMSGSPCQYDLSDVVGALNAGRGFLNYRGEGWSTGWWAHCYDMTTSVVNTLNNGRKLTFVTSIGCGVAMFDVSSPDNCFGETWIELGTPTEHRGGVAFVGPTSNTHTTYNNKIDKGIYVGMFQEGMDSPGEALLRGKLYMYNVYGNVQWVEYHYRIYHVLGDPSLHVWKTIPKTMTINHPSTIAVGFSQPQVTVIDPLSGFPVANARVTISGDGVYAYDTTSAQGRVTIDLTTSAPGWVQITVCGSFVPYEDSIEVILGTQNVSPNGAPVITDTDGNDDGLVNPNENCTIQYQLKNWGTAPSTNVYAKLTVPDTVTFVEIAQDSINFGTLNPNDSVSGAPFQFFVKPECPVGYVIPFQLYVASSSMSWNYTQEVLVHGCILEETEIDIDDAGNILNNLRLDPGETAKVRFKVHNKGDDNAPEITGILTSTDPYITILDSVGTFGSLLPDSSIVNAADYFQVKVSDNCPVKYNAPFTLKLSTTNGLYPYQENINTIIPVAMPSAPDPTGPDSYGYYAYSSADVLWQQSPQFNWMDISTIGTEIPKPVGLNDFTETVTLPFTFKYYGVNQTEVRISSDGWIAFGSGVQTSFLNKALPCNDTINNMVAAFWDDLFTNAPTTGKLLYYYDEPQHRFVVEWWQVPHLSSADDRETFEIILLDPSYYPTPTGDGEIIVQYHDIVESSSCTVGIEDGTETIGLLYLFDETYDVTANDIEDQFAIKYTTVSPVIVAVEDHHSNNEIPTAYSLDQNYPNPFNPSTRITFNIPDAGNVSLKIYRVDGQLVRTLANEYHPSGRFQAVWDGRNESGQMVSSGVYFYRLEAGSFAGVKKMILLK